jgi:hypothetical protein
MGLPRSVQITKSHRKATQKPLRETKPEPDRSALIPDTGFVSIREVMCATWPLAFPQLGNSNPGGNRAAATGS